MALLHKYFLYLLAAASLLCGCSTRYTYENSMEVDLPLEKTWVYFSHPNDYPIFSDKVEYFYCKEEEVEKGSIILVKFKDVAYFIPAQITEVEPFQKIVTVCNLPLCSSKEILTIEETSPKRTKIHSQLFMQSLFMPFIKSRITKGLDEHFFMLKDHLDQLAVEIHEEDKSCEF